MYHSINKTLYFQSGSKLKVLKDESRQSVRKSRAKVDGFEPDWTVMRQSGPSFESKRIFFYPKIFNMSVHFGSKKHPVSALRSVNFSDRLILA